MQDEQLLTKGRVFQDLILAGMEGANQPTQQRLEPDNHDENHIRTAACRPLLNHCMSRCTMF